MRYKYRARIESKVRPCGFLWLKEAVFHRYVLEVNFADTWRDEYAGGWNKSKDAAEWDANRLLDRIESKPQGTYV